MEARLAGYNSDSLDPKIIAVLSKIPNEPVLDKLKQWLSVNEVYRYITECGNVYIWS